MSRFVKQLAGILVLGGSLAIAPLGATAASAGPSAGCTAVNGGAWDTTITGPPTLVQQLATFDFAAGETINATMTASSVGTRGGASATMRNSSGVAMLLLSSGFGPFPTTVFSGSATVATSGPYYLSLGANSQYVGEVRSTTNVTCTPVPDACEPGSFSATGLAPCTPAPPGTYVDTAGATSATDCSIGHYQPNSGSSSCLAAAPGSYVPVIGSTAPLQCMAGSYQPDSAGSTCLAAPPGSYVDAPGAAAATPCTAGRYQGVAGTTMCTIAEPGTFVAFDGATAPMSCLTGYYQPNAGSTSCVAAQPGYFVATTGAIAQTPCPVGTTSEAAATGCTSVYVFTGFRAPVDAPPTLNSAKAGQAVPLKFKVTDSSGTPVTNLASVSVTVTSLACSVGTTADEVEEYSAGGEGLQNLGGGEYQYNWKTPKSYASSCKTLKLDIGDGVARTALFSFRK